MRLTHATSLLLAAVLMTGCARDNADYRASAAGPGFNSQAGVLAVAVPASGAAAFLPASAGRIIQVAERRFADGLSQDIILDGSRSAKGENHIEIAMRFQPQGETQTDNRVPLSKPSETAIASEIETRFPDVRMETVNVLLQNHYGPYGLAAGRRGNGERCIYAWQWIDDINNPTAPATPGLASALVAPPQPVSLRVRLCRSGVSADQLAGLVNELVVGGGRSRGQLPVLGQNGASGDALTAAGGGIATGQDFAGYQLPATGRFEATEPEPRVRVRARHANHYARHRRIIQRSARRQAPRAEPQYAAAPQGVYASPQAFVAQGQPLAPQGQAYAPQPQVYVPQNARVQPQMPSAQLAGRPQAYAVPQPVMSAPGGLHPLDQSLPPQAYRGPQANGAPLARPAASLAAPVYNTPPPGAGQTAPVLVPQGGRLQRDPVNPGAGI